MSYKVYVDKSEMFEADVKISGANVSNIKCRLLMETDKIGLVFNGNINNGKCSILIPKMQSLLDEGVVGKLKLEIIADDSYFQPWGNDFEVLRKTFVSVKEQTIKSEPTPDKVIIENVKISKENTDLPITTIKEIIREMVKSKVKKLDTKIINELNLSNVDINRINLALKKLIK